ncbi:MAG: hypothetical protein DHS20C04_05770 [Hyphococcus sp.]|nr:MAG: hypothetical protein DHS20C04_05770 [Marinicaulis sp.]
MFFSLSIAGALSIWLPLQSDSELANTPTCIGCVGLCDPCGGVDAQAHNAQSQTVLTIDETFRIQKYVQRW